MADHDEATADHRATAGLPHPAAVHSWEGNTPGYSDVTLEPGTYGFEGSALVAVEVVVERTLADEHNPPSVTLAPAPQFTGGELVVTETAEFRIFRSKGHLTLVQL